MSLRKSYLFLIILAFFLSGLSFLLATEYKTEWFSAFISNTATGIVASLIIIFFVDKIIERNKERERVAIIRVAIRRLRLPIIWHMTLLVNMYKAAVQNKPSTLPTTYQDIFTDAYYKEISFLDFSKDAPVALKMDWFNYIYSEVMMFKQKLEQIVDTYSAFLYAKLIDVLEKITDSHFIHFMPQAKMIPLVDRQQGFKRDYTMLAGMEELVKEHVFLMLQLIEYYNSYADSPIEFNQDIWRDDVAPKWGSSRI
jgi:hypothetical protein